MVESESKFGRRLFSSWADEVEKEEKAEEEEAQAQLQQKLKTNPFGLARPREVVLQEKGIDWRLLDLHLQQKYRQDLGRNQNSSKENNPIKNRVSKSVKQKLKDENFGLNLSPVIVVPPLRYPPRNMVATSSESRVLYGLDVRQQGFQCKYNSKPEKKNETPRNEAKEAHRSGSLDHGSHIHHARCIQQFSCIKSQNNKNACSVDYGQALSERRSFKKPATHYRRKKMTDSLLGKPPAVQGHGCNW